MSGLMPISARAGNTGIKINAITPNKDRTNLRLAFFLMGFLLCKGDYISIFAFIVSKGDTKDTIASEIIKRLYDPQ